MFGIENNDSALRIVGKEVEEIKNYISYIQNDGNLFERATNSKALKKA
jgi:hypothetical protein